MENVVVFSLPPNMCPQVCPKALQKDIFSTSHHLCNLDPPVATWPVVFRGKCRHVSQRDSCVMQETGDLTVLSLLSAGAWK